MAHFISFAQNAEDVMLWRALQTVEDGFYIDLGAGDPQRDSVTAAFYERGWRGVNVEPNPTIFQRLQAARPADVNLNVAIGAAPGEIDLFIVPDDDRLSTIDPDLAQAYSQAGRGLQRVPAPVRTLRDICEAHGRQPIHFLKIDVEGAEREALAGADLDRWRPWIILLEAIDPTTLEPDHAAWEGLLLAARYHFVYFDGLNRFYVADEKAELDYHFTAPPNTRDAFLRDGEAVAMDLRRIQAEHARVVQSLHDDVMRFRSERDGCIESRAEIHQAHLDATAEHAAAGDRAAAQAAELHALRTRLAEADAAIEAVKAAGLEEKVHALQAQLAEAEVSIECLTAERDGWMQEQFETNRYAAHLTQERQSMLEQHAARLEQHVKQLEQHVATAQHLPIPVSAASDDSLVLRHQNQALQDHIAAIRSSTSWRLTLPLRVLRRLAAGRRRGN